MIAGDGVSDWFWNGLRVLPMTCRVRRIGGVGRGSVRERRGLFCSGCVGKKCSSWPKKERAALMDCSLMERSFSVTTVYGMGVDALLQECAHRLLKKVRPESCHELVSSEIECGK